MTFSESVRPITTLQVGLLGHPHGNKVRDDSLNFSSKLIKPANDLFGLVTPSDGDFSVYVDYLRKKFSVPIELAAFVSDSPSFTDRVKYLPYTLIDFIILNVEDKKLKGRYVCGLCKGDYYSLCSVQTTNGLVHVLFCNDLKKFEKDFFDLPVEIKRGVFSLKKTMNGTVLSPLPLSSVTTPILNQDLLTELDEEINAFVLKEKVYRENELDYKRGILLYGLPGNGKTTLVKYFLSTLHKKSKQGIIGIIANSKDDGDLSFVKSFIANEEVKEELKIIVLEDIDGVDYSIRSSLLNLLDGVGTINKTIFIATTNFPEKLDVALRNRPSRFDSYYEIELPNEQSRHHFLTFYFPDLKGKELIDSVNKTNGFPGSYFKELFILTKLHEIPVSKAIIRLERKMKIFEEFNKNNGTSYIG